MSWTRAAEIREWWIRAESYSSRPSAIAATVVTDPARPTSVIGFPAGTAAAAWSSAVSMSLTVAAISAASGGSPCRCRSVSRTQPMFTERAPAIPSGPPRTNSVDPPPMSVTR